MVASRTMPILCTLYNTCYELPGVSTSIRYLSTKLNVLSNKSAAKHSSYYRKYCSILKVTKLNTRSLSSARLRSSGSSDEVPINKSQADELVLKLTEQERINLLTALQEFEANKVKNEYEAENVPPPNFQQLMTVGIFNAVPFIGFGFLDNAVMIIAGDRIEASLGAVITISTMAAAALGNTFSDVLGIGSAWYVEQLASKIGIKAPNLSPIQLDMSSSRASANVGRALGIITGCLLGMIPLLFMDTSDKKIPKEKK